MSNVIQKRKKKCPCVLFENIYRTMRTSIYILIYGMLKNAVDGQKKNNTHIRKKDVDGIKM